jgi:hypothetical protein
MSSLITLNLDAWRPALAPEAQRDAARALESGAVLVLPRLPFAMSESERRFLSPDWSDGRAKNISLDGKALKGSFDSFNDAKAKQVLSAFAVDTALVLAHIDIDEKSNEIPAVQKLLEELDVAGHIVTCDAMHCQKKPSKPRQRRTRI